MKEDKVMANGKRITRDMRIELLDMHNKLKWMCETFDETSDCYMSDVRNLRHAVDRLQEMFCFSPPKGGSEYMTNYVLEEEVEEHG
jgi:Ca2+-binding EF-hand superfamily protein